MIADSEKSFKAQLRVIAKEKNRDPADLWQNLTLERFLARLAQSEYAKHFILKGGILLSKYIDLGRETMDLDFLAQKISNRISKLREAFNTIVSIDLCDGFSFRELKVESIIHPHMGYPGAKAVMTAHFGKTRFKVAVDIGFGDVVDPIYYAIPLITSSKGYLFEGNIVLSCYPKEFIFAEKLETIVYRGSLNSRMKDFHDLYSMITSSTGSIFHNLDSIIRLVFEHRKTELRIPIFFTEDAILNLQNYWNGYRKSLRVQYASFLPTKMADLIRHLNKWLHSHTLLF